MFDLRIVPVDLEEVWLARISFQAVFLFSMHGIL